MSRPMDTEAFIQLLQSPQAVTDLRRYYGVGDDAGYTGGRYDRLDGGGDRPDVRDRVTAADLVAVQLLGVRVPPLVAVDLLEGPLGRALSGALAHIPVGVELDAQDAPPHIDDVSPANLAWQLLEARAGVGWVTAGKLLARKRPRLIPVYDSVVRCAYGARSRFWWWLHERLRADGGTVRRHADALRDRAGLPVEISPLRVIDVALWMRHRPQHIARDCPGIAPDLTAPHRP